MAGPWNSSLTLSSVIGATRRLFLKRFCRESAGGFDGREMRRGVGCAAARPRRLGRLHTARRGAAARTINLLASRALLHHSQLKTTFPELPDTIASKPFSNSV